MRRARLLLPVAVLALAGCDGLSNDVFLEGEGSVAGRLLLGGQPAASVELYVVGAQERRTVSASDGSFRLEVPSGEQSVIADDGQGFGRKFEVLVVQDRQTRAGDVPIEAYATMRGLIQDPRTGAGQPGVRVALTGTHLFSDTDANGNFVIESIPPGCYFDISYNCLSDRVFVCLPEGGDWHFVASPSFVEECDGLDNDCDGQVDEGDVCATPCSSDADCGPGEWCNAGVCEAVCGCISDADCAAGDLCDGCWCWPSCGGVVCNEGEYCDQRTQTCKPDPCELVTCGSGQVCNPDSGACESDCRVSGCLGQGETCNQRTGLCELTCGDEDEDGYDCRSDCDDTDATVFPGAEESCDGKDNDCDGEIDEDFGCLAGTTRACGSDVGICQQGVQTCNDQCFWDAACEGEVPPEAEVCDELDNDCDGQIDEGCPVTCASDADCAAGEICEAGICSQPANDPNIEVAPSSIDFGAVLLGQTGSATVTASSTGDEDLVISDLHIDPTGTDFALLGSPMLPIVLEPGSTTELTFGFTPSSVGAHSAAVVIETNSRDNPQLTIALRGTGAQDCATDLDGDGYCAESDDCDDRDPQVNPGAAEVCGDEYDNDCDGQVDEEC